MPTLQAVGLWISSGEWLVYDRRMGDVSAFVLAGGQSSRMGADKAFVPLDGQSLLIRALNLAASVAPKVQILGSKSKFGGHGEVVEDEFPDHGPLGGIHAALRHSSSELNLILAVDMPFVERRFLHHLVREAQERTAVVTVPRVGGQWQPLCAIYRRHFAELAHDALREGCNRIDALFGETTLHVLEESELEGKGFSAEMFRNLNTPEDLREATSRMRETFPASKG
jgi:molybdopterin-guanine dinucleotide biosynthesis protein A